MIAETKKLTGEGEPKVSDEQQDFERVLSTDEFRKPEIQRVARIREQCPTISEADAAVITQEMLYHRVQAHREIGQCERCQWPLPVDHYDDICPCCDYQPIYHAGDLKLAGPWDGKWWSQAREMPQVMKNMQAEIDELKAAWQQAWSIIDPATADDDTQCSYGYLRKRFRAIKRAAI